LNLLAELAGRVVVPVGVAEELSAGRELGFDVPDLSSLPWVDIRKPAGIGMLALIADLGVGEAQVLALALESPGSVVVLDDLLARRMAEVLGLRMTGTLGILLEAKRRGLVPSVGPLIRRLTELGFRVSACTERAVLALAGES
jgi:hypothetical protein